MHSLALTPTQIKILCEQYGFRPSKAYGQNYLISDQPIQAMVKAAAVTETDTIVEIGPGFGILTFTLSARAKKVIAFEIEQQLRPYWEEKMLEHPNVEIIWGNALAELETEIKNQKLKTYKVIANVPYQITSNLIRTLLELRPAPEAIVIMVQREVADRMLARPDGRDAERGEMSLLTLSVQYYARLQFVAAVKRGSFWPVPKVDSAVVALHDIKLRTAEESELFFTVAKAGFAHRRKMLWHNLSVGLSLDKTIVQGILQQVCNSTTVRAEELTVSTWEKLAQEFKSYLT